MKLTEKDFDGYPESCSTIKKIKSWIQEQGGYFEMQDLINKFGEEHYSFKELIIRYINPEHLTKFINEFIYNNEPKKFWEEIIRNKKFIKEEAKRFGSIKNAYELIKKEEDLERDYKTKHFELEKELEKYKGFKNFEELLKQNQELKDGYNYKEGTVLQVLNYFFKQSYVYNSYRTTNEIMHSTLCNLCKVALFDINDFTELMGKFKFRYWGSSSLEHYYSVMIESGNNSAWKSFEKAINRTPFILKNKRMYYGIKFKTVEDEKWVYYRCTGWNDDNKIKFVTDNLTGKQKRFSFDNKEFKAYFKNKKIEF